METTDRALSVRVNGEPVIGIVEPRTNLVDFLREKAGLTGTHTACHQGWCGSCTVLLDGDSVRSCLVLAVQADRCEVTTVEGVGGPDGTLSTLQEALIEHSGFQCGFCTPGFVVLGTEILAEARAGATFTRGELQRRLAANICRCTGYAGILAAVEAALKAVTAATHTTREVTP
ncbi:(2Fe-2S)-binding protein [Pseudonocardia kujensis]|uniref:(2Fe-2S)-binding protein n=1 Tax=Pseudonocardia kujensis TaxID=1128675 RepID=UPI001E5488BE|nr:(2Fe-2S)-binding protein [Pseudonocardia kujensis]MCE0763286.1 (2Fe-2S)-binding protein [Pseudonocardia kujensis]